MQKNNKFIRVAIANGSLEGLKWLGVFFMTLDHTNRFLFNDKSELVYSLGRIAMPLFIFVFVYNLARSKQFIPDVYYKSFYRLIIFGVLATPAYMAMMQWHGLFPLNILFTFLIVALVIFFFEENNTSLAVLTLIIGGFFVDYNWPGVVLGFSSWLYCRESSFLFLLLSLLSCASLFLVNDNNWALLAVPIIFLATKVDMKIPRIRYLFWVFYPLHLTVLWLIKYLF